MKDCSGCGRELLDVAGICAPCGCTAGELLLAVEAGQDTGVLLGSSGPLVLCIMNLAWVKRICTQTALVWAYTAFVALTTLLLTRLLPVFFFAAICGYGILFPIPPDAADYSRHT